MNTLRSSNGFKALSVLLAFAVVQISLQLAFAAPAASSFPTVQPQGVLGRITTEGRSPVTINGNNAASGDTVAPGSVVQTPEGTKATIDLGPLGSIEMSENTRIRIDYRCPPEAVANPNPEACKVIVTVLAGCIVSNYKQGTRHEIMNDKQVRIGQSDTDKEKTGGGTIRTCFDGRPAGAAAAAAGGIGKPALIALLAAAAVIPPAVILAAGGDDPSGTAP